MSVPFENVVVSEQFRQKKRPVRNYRINGLDTETDGFVNDGYARILANQDKWIQIKNIDDILLFLKQKKHQSAMNFFYNLRYDFEVLCNYDKSIFELLYEAGDNITVEYKRGGIIHLITYIPGKLFSIQWGHKVVKFFDIAQFFRKPLSIASEQYLGIKAHELKGDRADLFTNYSIHEIADYCQHDSLLTKLLAEWYIKQLHKINFYPSSLISTGNLSAQYLLKNTDIPKVKYVPKEVLELYYNSFKGGWFDIYKRGTIPTYKYDINSAYPFAFSDFIDIRDGIWVNEIDEEDTFGVVKCLAHSSPDQFLPIGFPNKTGGRVYHLVDEPVVTYLTKKEFLSLEKDYKLEPLDFYSFRPLPIYRKPYKEVIKNLYEMKSSYKHDIGIYNSTKEIANSIYGKNVEKRKTRIDGTPSLITGNLWNPVYGSECTGSCRMQIYNTFKNYRKDIVSIATDGIALKRKPRGVPLSTELGDWDFEGFSPTTYIMSGIYCDDQGHVKSRGLKKINQGTKITDKTRGTIKVNNMLEALDTPDPEIEIDIIRPTHYREAIIQKRIQDIGKFENHPRKITASGDLKRLWVNSPISLNQLLKEEFTSVPIPTSLSNNLNDLRTGVI